jgi:hypothetical protein
MKNKVENRLHGALRSLSLEARPSPPPVDSTPTILSVDNTSAPYGTQEFWVRVTFHDAACDITGGTVYGLDGVGHDFGYPAHCSNGGGSFSPFALNCAAPPQPGQWPYWIVLRDATGATSPRFSFVQTCA